MEYKYDAFISYRHAEVDSAVAKDIQHWLEHFHVPKAIQKASGKKKISRVFRDKEELPLSMNLGETITDALIHSEYLIVICSPRTKESQWVQRESEAFLETHDLEHILVVIAEGEPDDVIPKMLTYKETTAINENGEEITIKEDLEPLGCDYRVGKRKAHKEELPRLAASLLHCSYDDLIQRARQYRTRVISGILATILALALGILGYVLYSNQQIKTNYENALRAQSEYLASESLKSHENDDRSAALALALEALPSETNDRPYVAKAEYALGVAVGIYDGLYTSQKNDLFRPSATYTVNSRITDARTNQGIYVAVLDKTNTISIFNSVTDRFENSFQIDSKSESIDLVGITLENLLICNYGPHICGYSIPDGKKIWNWTSLVKSEWSEEEREGHIGEASLIGNELFFYSNDSIYRLNAETGNLIKEYPIPSFPEGIDGMKDTDVQGIYQFGEINNNYLPFEVGATMDDSYDFGMSGIPAILDLNTDSISFFPQGHRSVNDLAISNDGNLIVLSDDNEFVKKSIIAGFKAIPNHTTYISCVDPVSKQTVWEVEKKCYSSYEFYHIENVKFTNEDSHQFDAIASCFGNIIYIIDPSDGTIIKNSETPGPLVGMHYNNRDALICVTRNGDLCISELCSDKDDNSFQVFPSPLDEGSAEIKTGVKSGNGVLISRNNSVIMYKAKDQFNDGSLKPINVSNANTQKEMKLEKSKFIQDSLIDDNIIAFLFEDCLLYSDGASNPKLKYIDLKEYVNEDYATYGFKSILGALSNHHLLIASNPTWSTSIDKPFPIVEIDLESGKTQKYELIKPTDLDSYASISNIHLIDDTLFYTLDESGNDHLYLITETYGNKATNRIDLGLIDHYTFVGDGITIDSRKKMAAIFLSNNTDKLEDKFTVVRMVDLSTSTLKDIKLNRKSSSFDLETECAWYSKDSEPSLIAIAEDHSLSIWNDLGERIGEIPITEGKVNGIHFLDDKSLVCSVNTGKTTELVHYNNNYSQSVDFIDIPTSPAVGFKDWKLVSNHYLVCFSDYLAAIVDTEQWQFIAIVPYARGYQNTLDRFVCADSENNEWQFGYRKRYTTESLIAKAKEVLGNYKLTDSQRAEYGLQ